MRSSQDVHEMNAHRSHACLSSFYMRTAGLTSNKFTTVFKPLEATSNSYVLISYDEQCQNARCTNLGSGSDT
jgi:hypothetical protein